MISALRIRYTLLPYYYTLFYKAHTQGSTVIRPLFHEFPTDKTALDIYLQVLIGPHIMLAPVTDDGARQVQVYIPSSHWYDFYTGSLIQAEQQFVTIEAPLDTIPIFLRGGAILPTQGYALNTKYSRGKPFGLIIVLNANGRAEGDLFYDDGESLDTIALQSYYYASFKWSSDDRQLSFNVTVNNYADMSRLILDSLTIYGWNRIPTAMRVDNKQLYPVIKSHRETVHIENLALIMSNSHTITWDEILNHDN
jgi:maltase-glucoamylase